MRRLTVILPALAMLVLGIFGTTTSAQAAITFNPSAAPQGTHVQTGTPGCTVDPASQLVTCNTYELAGVGNTNATATLSTTYSATVRCRNHGGQIVDVKSQVTTVPKSTGELSPKNGRLTVPSLSSAPVPSAADFESRATCPNRNWTKELLPGSITLTGYTYTLSFTGYTGSYITITP